MANESSVLFPFALFSSVVCLIIINNQGRITKWSGVFSRYDITFYLILLCCIWYSTVVLQYNLNIRNLFFFLFHQVETYKDMSAELIILKQMSVSPWCRFHEQVLASLPVLVCYLSAIDWVCNVMAPEYIELDSDCNIDSSIVPKHEIHHEIQIIRANAEYTF